ncbi:hypothetical protein B0H34DRAFT_675332 [Crassisporium funariophilum]|nr:hypothetical protein B0H34DRAFT_675332 [Crassisporium funariophilum]
MSLKSKQWGKGQLGVYPKLTPWLLGNVMKYEGGRSICNNNWDPGLRKEPAQKKKMNNGKEWITQLPSLRRKSQCQQPRRRPNVKNTGAVGGKKWKQGVAKQRSPWSSMTLFGLSSATELHSQIQFPPSPALGLQHPQSLLACRLPASSESNSHLGRHLGLDLGKLCDLVQCHQLQNQTRRRRKKKKKSLPTALTWQTK